MFAAKREGQSMKIPYRVVGAVLASATLAALAMAPAMADASSWKVYNYNPSGRALAPVAPSSVSDNTVTFSFGANTYTALLATSDNSLTGDLTGKALTASVSWSGVTGTFQEQNGGGCTPDNQYVRLYFATPGFAFTHFWWSNPVHVDLTGGAGGPTTLTVPLTATDSNGASQWSDWNGQLANSSDAVSAAFSAAVAKVSTVGLSFGGGCFFENGVTTSDGTGSFTSTFTETP
jgi:hypothetical protein